MSIASEITRINTNIANAYTACNGKGATMPQTQNSANLATTISSIPSGGGGGGIPREVVNGVYQVPVSSFTFSLPSNATDIGAYALIYAFFNSTGLTSVDLSSLESVSGSYAFYFAFYNSTGLTSVDLGGLTTITASTAFDSAFDSTGLTSVDLSSLESVSGSYAFNNAFRRCPNLTSVDLSSLESVSGSYAFSSAFGSTGLTSVDLSSLESVSGSNAFYFAFTNTSLSSLSFPSLTSNSFGSYTDQFHSMLNGVNNCTVHFPSNLQSVIGSWLDVTSGFGGTNTTVLFDLPATT